MRQRAAYLLLQNQIKNPNNWTKLMYLEYLSLKLKEKKRKHVSLSLRYCTELQNDRNLMESHNHTISGNFALITPKKVLNNKCS
jgi:hypothetical protein